MKNGKFADPLHRRHRRLAARLSQVGLILQGTITERTIVRDAPTARGRPRAYGPYYQWTWKHQGKTVTVNLTASQASAYQKAIDNHRELDQLVRELRVLSQQLLEATTPSVRKRKPRQRPHLRLS